MIEQHGTAINQCFKCGAPFTYPRMWHGFEKGNPTCDCFENGWVKWTTTNGITSRTSEQEAKTTMKISLTATLSSEDIEKAIELYLMKNGYQAQGKITFKTINDSNFGPLLTGAECSVKKI